MPQLDRLLSAVISNKADALTLDEGDPAKLELQGSARAVTKSPLTAQQVVGLIKEIAPPDAGRQLETARSAAFTYTSADGAFAVRAAHEGGKWRARITPGNGVPSAESAAGGFDPLSGFQPSAAFLTPSEPPKVMRPTPAASMPARPAMPTPNAAMPNVPPPLGTPVFVPAQRPATATPAAAAAPAAAPPPPALAAAAPQPATGAALDHVHDFEGSVEARATIEQLLRTTVERGASDLHLRCGEPPIIRLHGEMHRLDGWGAARERPSRQHASLDHAGAQSHRVPGHERHRLRVTRSPAARASARMRCVIEWGGRPSSGRFRRQVVTVEQMRITQEVQQLCYLTKGLVLVTGPTGSGKSTTLCALIDWSIARATTTSSRSRIRSSSCTRTRSASSRSGRSACTPKSFKSALRAALREDPDIVLVGELRDLETVAIAIETAETGHLVFGTLHTTTAPARSTASSISSRPTGRSRSASMLSESLKGVISQTLCKKIGGGRVAAREMLLVDAARSRISFARRRRSRSPRSCRRRQAPRDGDAERRADRARRWRAASSRRKRT